MRHSVDDPIRPLAGALGVGFTVLAFAGSPAAGAGQELEPAAGGPPAPGQRVVLVTGSTGGLGREVARRLADVGAHVIVHGRSLERGTELVDEIQAAGTGSARFYAADFGSLDRVRALAGAVRRDYDRLDVLVNNAGVWLDGPRRMSEDGHELHFQVNYLAGFLLTHELLPLLRESAPARVVNVSSIAQRPIDFDDVMLEDGYSDGRAYAQSKLAQVMFTLDLAERLEGSGVSANALHPASMMDTDMVLERGARARTSVHEGADAVVYLVDAPDLGSGKYFNQTTEARANDQAYDEEARARLWAMSVRWTGLEGPSPGQSRPPPLQGPPDRVGGDRARERGLHHHEGLGSLSFPTSGSPEAQPAFERGVLLMHSFEYEDAAAAFREARELDPDFAMAYWGEAMTHNHPLWDQQDRAAALAVLDRYAPDPEARVARVSTGRERLYFAAVEALYGEGSKAARDTAYARAMERLVEAHPEDFEARAFHALALLGLSRGERDVPTYMRAGARALHLFEENPDHPGAAHYAIHSFDDPTHAPLGLEAALAYADVAPDAAHAQHMTTHIFLALGRWEGVVEANERADAVVDRSRAARGLGPTSCGHYNEWLAYGYQQRGRDADSESLVLGCLAEVESGGGSAGSAALMRALHLGSTADFDGPVARKELDRDAVPPGTRTSAMAVQDWASGYAAAGRGDGAEAARRLRALEARLDQGDDLNAYWASYAPIWRGTLRSVVAAVEGDLEEAVAAARGAAEHEAGLPVDFGPPISFKPPRELEGEMLLEAGRAAEALAAFRMALQRTPRRAPALAGLARAAEVAGEEEVAREAYRELEAVRAGAGGVIGGGGAEGRR